MKDAKIAELEALLKKMDMKKVEATAEIQPKKAKLQADPKIFELIKEEYHSRYVGNLKHLELLDSCKMFNEQQTGWEN